VKNKNIVLLKIEVNYGTQKVECTFKIKELVMERRINSIRKKWLLGIAKYLLKNQKKQRIVERRKDEKTVLPYKVVYFIRNAGNNTYH